jgi:hypothetical protein
MFARLRISVEFYMLQTKSVPTLLVEYYETELGFSE